MFYSLNNHSSGDLFGIDPCRPRTKAPLHPTRVFLYRDNLVYCRLTTIMWVGQPNDPYLHLGFWRTMGHSKFDNFIIVYYVSHQSRLLSSYLFHRYSICYKRFFENWHLIIGSIIEERIPISGPQSIVHNLPSTYLFDLRVFFLRLQRQVAKIVLQHLEKLLSRLGVGRSAYEGHLRLHFFVLVSQVYCFFRSVPPRSSPHWLELFSPESNDLT